MRVSYFNKEKGMYTGSLPNNFDGVVELAFLDADGKHIRLLDAVGDREKWTLHAKPGCSILPLTVDGDDFTFESAVHRCVLQDRFACQVMTQDGTVYFLLFTDTRENHDVFLVSLPLDRTVTIGFSNSCGIRTDFPVVNDAHLMIQRGLDGLTVKALNGSETFVNGKILDRADGILLHAGGILDIYGMRLLFMGEFAAVYCSMGRGMADRSISGYVTRINSILADTRREEGSQDCIFNRSPRIYMKHETPKFNVDSPPSQQNGEEQPLILAMGSSAMMGMSSIMMATMTMQTAIQNKSPFISVLPSVLMSSGMFVGSLVMPIINRKYTDSQKEKKEKKRREKYIRYLRDTMAEITKTGEHQKRLLEETYPTTDELVRHAFARDEHLWERMLNHEDFLDLRIGRARIDIDMEINDPGDHFSMEEDDVRDAFDRFRKAERTVADAPYMLKLREVKVLGIFGEYGLRMRYVRSLIMQVCTQHSYKELKIALICPDTAKKDWEFARWLPHCWNDEKSFRYWGSTVDEVRSLSVALQNMCFSERTTRKEEEQLHTLIIIADKALSENCRSLINAMKRLDGYPVSIIALAGTPGELPKECHSVISLKETGGALFNDINQLEKATGFTYDPMLSEQVLRDLAVRLRHTHLAGEEAEGALPDSLTFFDMLRCGNVRQMNAAMRWKNSDPIHSLAAPMGSNKDGSLLMLDIHQNAHGPHGLVAGTTGSGKSELLISYLLSMAVYYDPLEVGFVLIDYKGGGMSDTLKALPHVVGVIDNLGGRQGIHRAMVCITNELRRRQAIFKETGDRLGMKNIDIHSYQGLYRSGKVEEPLQHLVIVSDEFAELKQQEPDFMDDLVSAARIGRSLGVHLILATQRPTGVVNDQILSNTRFRVCMKVQDRGDSMSMIGKPDAAMLTKAGRFYLQVGMDEVFELGQSAWSGADTVEKEFYTQEPDRGVEVLNNQGLTVAKAIPAAYVHKRKEGEVTEKQVDTIVRYLAETAKEAGKKPKQIWLPMLSAQRTLDGLEQTYEPSFTPWMLDPVVGEVDDPVRQAQYPLQMQLTEGNTVIMGNAGSGQEEMVDNIIYSLCTHHAPEEVHIYVLDFAMETTRSFMAMPHVGDVMGAGENEKIANFMAWLDQESARRRMLISNYGGSLDLVRKSGQKVPNVLVIIQNFAAFTEAFEAYEDNIYALTRDASSFGIYFVITATNTRAVRSKILQTFRQYFCLEMADEMEYMNLLGKTNGIKPMKRKGSGICAGDGRILEFQTAMIFPDTGENATELLRKRSREVAEQWKGKGAEKVRVLPEHVCLQDLTEDPAAISMRAVPVGISKTRLDPVTLDFWTNGINLILYREAPEYPFFPCFTRMIGLQPERKVYVLDAGSIYPAGAGEGYTLAQSDSDLCRTADELFNLLLSRWKENKEAQEKGSQVRFGEVVILITAIRNLTDTLKNGEAAYPQLGEKFDEMLKRIGSRLGMTAVIIGKPADLSACSIRPWYSAVSRSSGLWLGGGITNQQMLNQSVSMREVLPEGPYGYAVRNEKAQCVKLLEQMSAIGK